MTEILDLENHHSITSAKAIDHIVKPLQSLFGIKSFRYLKLFKNGNRVVLSNIPDAIRYMYGNGHYKELWYDGEFPQFLKPGWHNWNTNRLLDTRSKETEIENELVNLLQVIHGTTYIVETSSYYEIFSFDSSDVSIYSVEKNVLLRFIYYFREQAHKYIHVDPKEMIYLPIQNNTAISHPAFSLDTFLENTKINRFYVNSEFGEGYLTTKELVCMQWMSKGKTAEEIAIIVGIHQKTVQRHIENIKNKFNFQKQTQIIQLLLNSGLSDIVL